MNGELLMKKLADKIGELEVANIMLQMQIEELVAKVKELEGGKSDD